MKRREKYNNGIMVNKLIEQQKAHNSFARELIYRIEFLEEQYEQESNCRRDYSISLDTFFIKKHPELIQEFVELVYDLVPETAKIIVGSIHEEALDLSTLKCTGNDFTKWS